MNGTGNRWALGAVLSVGLLAGMPATAGVVLTFSDLTNTTTSPPFGTLVSTYTADSFQMTNSEGTTALPSFIAWSKDDIFNADLGGATLTTNYAQSTTTLSKIGGGGFFFNSIGLADFQNDSNDSAKKLTVTFAFTYEDTTSSSQSVDTDVAPGLENFSFDLGKKVTKVTWNAKLFESGNAQQIQFDNIVLDGGVPPTGVPEPTSLALVGLALGGLGLSRRRVAMA